MIDAIVFEPEVGGVYDGKVVKILASKDKANEDVGCFVEYAPGKEGMVHISKICNKRINRVTDAGIDVGSEVKVKYLGLDKKGRMDFSIKDAAMPESMVQPAEVEEKHFSRPLRKVDEQ
jgi:polyribonucleotide nucleotidyltransferase